MLVDYYKEKKKEKEKEKPKNIQNLVLYIGDLPAEVDQFELHQFIMSLGKFEIESMQVKPTQFNKSYAYVKFRSKQEVEKAKQILNLQTFKDQIIKAEAFRKGKSKEKENENVNSEHTNIFIKNLPSNTTPKDLYDLGKNYGEIISIKLKQNKNGECIGYGYINYVTNTNAMDAIESLNGGEYRNNILHVELFANKKEREEEEKFPLVLIKNLPDNISNDEQLNELFAKFGSIAFSGIINKDEALMNDGNRYGVVLYNKREDASDAINHLNNHLIGNSLKPLELSIAPISKEIMDKLYKAKQESFKRKYEGCNLVVKNLPKDLNERTFFEIFKQFGDVLSARIATEGLMKEIKNNEGMIIDKAFVYESKGYGFVLFKNVEDAKRAKEEINFKEITFKGIDLRLAVEYYNYSKEKVDKMNKTSPNKKKFKKSTNELKSVDDENTFMVNNRMMINPKEKKNMKKNNPFDNLNNRIVNNNNNNKFQQNNLMAQQQQMYMQNLQNMQWMNMNNYPNMTNNINNNMPNNNINNMQQNMTNQPVIRTKQVDNIDIINQIKLIIQQMPFGEERRERLGETLFYFLLHFIQSFSLNNSNGMFDDANLCSKLTGILINVDDKDLIEILGNNDILVSTIKDVTRVRFF